MFLINQTRLAERFIKYAKIDTQSDPDSNTFPTTEKQKNLSKVLHDELVDLGLDASMDQYGYVYASIPSNSPKAHIPKICFCSHIDTAPDCSGTNVKPILHKNYDGSDIIMPDDPSLVLKVADYPYLKKHIGHDIITASGKTLLGADDKSGVAIIMEMAAFLVANPSLRHGDIKIVFTPDEEVGKGTAKIDITKIGADYGYTLDGGEAGSLEDETFSADGVEIEIYGVSAHPGYAKGKMVNALKLAGEVLYSLPKTSLSPESTTGKKGFVHPVACNGIAEKATLKFIIRDFKTSELQNHENTLKSLAEKIVYKYPGASMKFTVSEQYRNMKEVLQLHPQVISNAAEAIKRAGLKVSTESIRGGTDGSRLSFMGLPSANIFTGMQAIHSKLEWIGVNDMISATNTLIHLAIIWEENA